MCYSSHSFLTLSLSATFLLLLSYSPLFSVLLFFFCPSSYFHSFFFSLSISVKLSSFLSPLSPPPSFHPHFYSPSFCHTPLTFSPSHSFSLCFFPQYYDTEFSLWDRFEVQGDMTLKEFIDYFQVSQSIPLYSSCLSFSCPLFNAYIQCQTHRSPKCSKHFGVLIIKGGLEIENT